MSSTNGSDNDRRRRFRNVTAAHPCPNCHKPDQCSVSEDGDYCVCYRVGEPSQQRTASDGRTYWVHRLTPAPRPTEPRYSLADGGGRLADPDIRHEIYYALLQCLDLSSQHEAALKARGLKTGLKAAGYRSLPERRRYRAVRRLIEAGFEEHLPTVPGFFVAEREGKYWTVSGASGLLIPIRDLHDRIIALMVRPDDLCDGGKYRWLSSKKRGGPGPGAPIHVPRFKGDKGTVRITEGALKADVATRLSDMLTIGLPGVGAWRRTARVLRELGATTARVAFDADACHNQIVAECLSHLVNHLRRYGFIVELELWDEADGKGIDDLLAAGKQPELVTEEAVIDSIVKRIVEDARKADPPPIGPLPTANGFGGGGLPQIQFNKRQLRDVTNDALNAILAANKPPRLFQRGNLLVRVRTTPDTQTVNLEPMVVPALRGHLTRVADWFREKITSKGDRFLEPDAPPHEVATDLANLPAWSGVPCLRAVIECPAYGWDGSLVDQPGYNEGAQLWYEPAHGLSPLSIPTNPTSAEIEAARHLLLVELLGDFPFDDEASKANALAALLVPFVRQMIDGPIPLHLLDAPVEGTNGASLIVFRPILRQFGHGPR